MSKVLVMGIDALDVGLLSEFEPDLPNFRKLMKQNPKVKLHSVFPPDSATVWTSLHTGINPAKHGMVFFLDAADSSGIVNPDSFEGVIYDTLPYKSFWDIAGMAGRRVCLLFPFLIYPSRPVNGIMISRSQKRDVKRFPVRTYPASIAEKYELHQLNTLKGNAVTRPVSEFIEAGRRLVLDETEFALKMMRDYDWDLFFMYSAVIDGFGHSLWRYCDPGDPTYPGDNPYKESIKDCYKLYDESLGKIMTAIGNDATIIVVSDHGHGRRPIKLANINEILRSKGFLVPKSGGLTGGGQLFSAERLKVKLQEFVVKHHLERPAVKLLGLIPWWKKVYLSVSSIDWQETSAYVSDLSGVNAYSYAGIKLRQENIKNTEYEEMRSLLIEELSQLNDPDTGENLFNWIYRREELYQGEHISRYPDILFELKDDYGAGWSIYHSTTGTTYSHKVASGCHKGDRATILFSKLGDRKLAKKDMTVMDVAPTILDLLGVKGDFNFDGGSIFRQDA